MVAARVGDATGDGLADPPGGVRGELEPLAPVELLDGVHQAEVALLDQVQQGQARRLVLLGDRHDQPQVRLHERLLGLLALHARHAGAHASSPCVRPLGALADLGFRVPPGLDGLGQAYLVVLGQQRVLTDVRQVEPDEILVIALDSFLRQDRRLTFRPVARQENLAGLSRSSYGSWRPFPACVGCGDSVMALSRWAYSRENTSSLKRLFNSGPEPGRHVGALRQGAQDGRAAPDLRRRLPACLHQDLHDRPLADRGGRSADGPRRPPPGAGAPPRRGRRRAPRGPAPTPAPRARPPGGRPAAPPARRRSTPARTGSRSAQRPASTPCRLEAAAQKTLQLGPDAVGAAPARSAQPPVTSKIRRSTQQYTPTNAASSSMGRQPAWAPPHPRHPGLGVSHLPTPRAPRSGSGW